MWQEPVAVSSPVPPLPATPPGPEKQVLQEQAEVLLHDLTRHLGHPLQLRVTNNASTMLSLRQTTAGILRLSLHLMFLSAPQEVRKALAQWVRRPRARKPGSIIDTFIREHNHTIKKRDRPRAQRLVTRGAHHDLQKMFDRLNQDEFDGAMTATITWGRMPPPKSRRSIRFGSYAPADNLIRMHPLLDQEFVPEFFVAYIVFHEMLHEFFGIEETASGRRCIHPKVFKEREQRYKEYGRAMQWLNEDQNLRRLLQRPRRAPAVR